MRVSPATSHSLPAQVHRELIRLVVTGQLQPGDALPPVEALAGQFQVSRAVIREAMRSVAGLGLLVTSQGRTARVAPYRNWEHLSADLLQVRAEEGAVEDILAELLQIRHLLEVDAAGLAAQHATDADLAELRSRMAELDAATSQEAYIDADIAFHEAVITAVGNHLLSHLFHSLRPLLLFSRRIDHEASSPDVLTQSQRGHRAVLDELERHDPDAARKAMKAHLAQAQRDVARALSQRRGKQPTD